jgi:hypothetical protein
LRPEPLVLVTVPSGPGSIDLPQVRRVCRGVT